MKAVSLMMISVVVVLVLAVGTVQPQRRIIGDIQEQKISQLADFDAREERVYRWELSETWQNHPTWFQYFQTAGYIPYNCIQDSQTFLHLPGEVTELSQYLYQYFSWLSACLRRLSP